MKEDIQSYKTTATALNGDPYDIPFADMSENQKLFTGIKLRLQLMSPYVDKWPQAMALGLQPQNWSNTAGQINAISDEIWF